MAGKSIFFVFFFSNRRPHKLSLSLLLRFFSTLIITRGRILIVRSLSVFLLLFFSFSLRFSFILARHSTIAFCSYHLFVNAQTPIRNDGYAGSPNLCNPRHSRTCNRIVKKKEFTVIWLLIMLDLFLIS